MGIIKEIKESLTSFARNHPLLLLYLILFVIISLSTALDYGYSAAAKILVYGILCEIFALVGFIPIAGPFIYCFLVDSYLNPLVPGLGIYQFAMFMLGLLDSVILTLTALIVLLVWRW